MKREKTKYPGVFFREVERIGGPGLEKVYYVVYKKAGKLVEEKAGRQFADDMTPARAAGIRAELIEGKRKTRKEIREEEEARKKEEEARKKEEENRWTFSRLWEEYKVQHSLKGLAQDESRYRMYIEPAFKDREPKSLVQLDIDRMRIKLLKTKEPQTVKNILALLRRIVNFGMKKGLCPGPGFIIQMPSKINNIKTEDMDDNQLARFLQVLDEDHDIQATNLMRLAIITGMRRGELFRLRWDDISFDRGVIWIRDPKGGTDQNIPLNQSAREILGKHPRTEGSPYVFPGRHGKQRVEIRKAVNRIKRKAGLPEDFRPLHGLRHTYACMSIASGEVDLYTLQKLLRHKHSDTTERYAHHRDSVLRKASEVAGNIIKEASGESKVKAIRSET